MSESFVVRIGTGAIHPIRSQTNTGKKSEPEPEPEPGREGGIPKSLISSLDHSRTLARAQGGTNEGRMKESLKARAQGGTNEGVAQVEVCKGLTLFHDNSKRYNGSVGTKAANPWKRVNHFFISLPSRPTCA